MSGEISVAGVRQVLDALLVERERLRRLRADAVVLDANLVAISYWQDELTRAQARTWRSVDR